MSALTRCGGERVAVTERASLRPRFWLRSAHPSRARHGQVILASGRRSAVVILPGFLYGASAYREMASNFRRKGRVVETTPVRAWQWASTIAGGSFDFYLEAAKATVEKVYEEHGPVAVVGHSAGGWLARLLLGHEPYNGRVWDLAPKVHTLLCLGSPHLCREDYPYGRIPEQLKLTEEQAARAPGEVAASSLCFANHFYPTAHSLPGVHIVCVVGRAVQGEDTQAFALLPEPFATERSRKQFAYDSYKANCGRGDVWGDGVCPIETGLLPGADVVQLQDVWHMHGSGHQWYGSSSIVSMLNSCIADHPAVAAGSSCSR